MAFRMAFPVPDSHSLPASAWALASLPRIFSQVAILPVAVAGKSRLARVIAFVSKFAPDIIAGPDLTMAPTGTSANIGLPSNARLIVEMPGPGSVSFRVPNFSFIPKLIAALSVFVFAPVPSGKAMRKCPPPRLCTSALFSRTGSVPFIISCTCLCSSALNGTVIQLHSVLFAYFAGCQFPVFSFTAISMAIYINHHFLGFRKRTLDSLETGRRYG